MTAVPARARPRRSLRLKVIGCEVLARQIYQRAATSAHVIDVELLEKRLHEEASVLRTELQRRIDAVESPPYDAIVLVYGLCNRATEGLVARTAPLVIARAHDCITLYLGSRERYAAEFDEHPGTYYYSADYLERGKDGRPAQDGDAAADEGMAFNSRIPARYEDLVRRYGEDNARYLAGVYGSWHEHYSRAAYIHLPCTRCEVAGSSDAAGCAHAAPFRERAVSMAAKHGWEYTQLEGDLGLIDKLLDGDWFSNGAPTSAILVVPTGAAIFASFDERVIIAAPAAL